MIRKLKKFGHRFLTFFTNAKKTKYSIKEFFQLSPIRPNKGKVPRQNKVLSQSNLSEFLTKEAACM